jgi:hypothetical protein
MNNNIDIITTLNWQKLVKINRIHLYTVSYSKIHIIKIKIL